jgi:hypothetical protein
MMLAKYALTLGPSWGALVGAGADKSCAYIAPHWDSQGGAHRDYLHRVANALYSCISRSLDSRLGALDCFRSSRLGHEGYS